MPVNKAEVNHTRIARTIFAVAESIGMSDRKQVERLAARVIERLEQTPLPAVAELVEQPFPGMENLVPHRRKPLPTDTEIQAMVMEILEAEKPAQREEVKPEMESTAAVKPTSKPSSGINLGENA
ncbi:unnamed protein product, partial [marine sediment metagenome]